MKKSTMLRQMWEKEPVLFSVWVGTAHQAQLAAATGFELIGISGSNTSTQILGLPDAGFLTQTELVDNAQRICAAVDVPVLVDCDTGFGNAVNVKRTVELVIRAGAAGLFIEDQVAPKRCGFSKGKRIIPLEEAVGKYRAAVAVRDELDPDFIIMARTDGRGAVGGSLEEAIRRGKAYKETRIDILYVEALQSREEIKAVREAIPDIKLMATGQAIKPPLQAEEIRELGLCLSGCHIGYSGSIAMYNLLKDIKVRGMSAFAEFMQQNADHPLGGFGTFDIAGFPKVVEWEQKYLPSEELNKYDQSLGVYDPRVGHTTKKEEQ